MQVAALVNTRSGSGLGRQVQADLSSGGVPSALLTDGLNVGAWVDSALAGGAEVLLAAGGDGTIASVAQAAAGRAPLVVVPVGTRNHFAVDLGLDPGDPVATMRACLAGSPRRVDLGELNGDVFLNNVSFGIYASAVSDPAYRSGRLRVMARTARAAVSGRGETAQIRTPVPVDVPPGARIGAILVSNNSYDFAAAPGQKLRATLDSGRLWVYLLGAPRALGRLPLLRAIQEMLTTGSVSLGTWQVSDLEFDSDRPVPVACDGEYRPAVTPPYRLSSRPGALEVLVPVATARASTLTMQW
jgi:diacylglycerol kinase family enzyme